MVKLNKIYTRTGDDGTTGLFGGPRVRKNDARVAAYGDVDELNSFLGAALASQAPEQLLPLLTRVQHELFDLGAGLASPRQEKLPLAMPTSWNDWWSLAPRWVTGLTS